MVLTAVASPLLPLRYRVFLYVYNSSVGGKDVDCSI